MRGTNAMKNKLIITVIVALSTVVLGGCATNPWGTGSDSTSAAASEIELLKAELALKEEAIAQQQLQLDAEKARRTDMSNELESVATQTDSGVDKNRVTPLKGQPGECYAQVIIPAKFETTAAPTVKREASNRFEIIPASYKEVNKNVVVKAEATKLEVIAATYETVEELVMIKPVTTWLEVIPAEYETVEERVMIKPATTRLEVIPAEYETVEERVMIKPETTRLEVIPAVYETIEDREEIRQASERTVEIPAEYKTVSYRVVDRPGHTEWKYVTDIETGSGAAPEGAIRKMIERFPDHKILETRIEDAGVLCLVEIPETYKDVRRQEISTPAQTRTETIPAEYKMVKKMVLKSDATTSETIIPAQYKMVKKTVLKSDATTRETTIPAEYQMVKVTREIRPETIREITAPAEYVNLSVTKENSAETTRAIAVPAEYGSVLVTEEISHEDVKEFPIDAEWEQGTSTAIKKVAGIEWHPVLCKVNMTQENVGALQSALNANLSCQGGANCNHCKVDGQMGPCTLAAARRFAEKETLSWGQNYVTLEVIRALGLDF